MILRDAQPSQVLLDTCALIYLFNGNTMSEYSVTAIDAASVLVSPISAWEIGIFAQKRFSPAPAFRPDVNTWFQRVLAAPSVIAAPFDVDVALLSCGLPEPLHRDPADRFLIATARLMGIPIVTRDRLILAYAESGHVDAIAC